MLHPEPINPEQASSDWHRLVSCAPTSHWIPQAKSPVMEREGPPHPNLGSWWKRGAGADAGGINQSHRHTCCLPLRPATFDLLLVRRTRGRCAACGRAQEVSILNFRVSFQADLQLGAWLCRHPLLSAQAFLPLEMVAVGLSLPRLHPEGLLSDSCFLGSLLVD